LQGTHRKEELTGNNIKNYRICYHLPLDKSGNSRYYDIQVLLSQLYLKYQLLDNFNSPHKRENGGFLEDANIADKKFHRELNAGIAALVLLNTLNKAEKSMYGYQIATFVGEDKQGEPVIKQGALYPVLHSLEDNQLLKSEVEPSVTGPPRRYYTITSAGREALERWIKTWQRTRNYVDSMLTGERNDKQS
jgi:PadR family transcriptional regulator PadR